jgi:uncharacterized membrane protein YcaP (DUF421 family)
MWTTLEAWLDALFGLSVSGEHLSFGQMTARAAFIYIAMIAVVRGGKKRALGRATVFDVILLMILASIAARAITGGTAYFPAVFALAVLVLMHWVFSAIARKSPAFSGWIKGHSTLVIKDGRIQHEALGREHMSRDDLDEDLREQGVADVSEVAEARLERSGKLSVIRK